MYSSSNSSVKVNIKQEANNAVDASRLYGEIKEKALKDIHKTISINLKPINLDVEVIIYREHDSWSDTVRILFKFNGCVHDEEISIESLMIDKMDRSLSDRDFVINSIREQISKIICNNIINDVWFEINNHKNRVNYF